MLNGMRQGAAHLLLSTSNTVIITNPQRQQPHDGYDFVPVVLGHQDITTKKNCRISAGSGIQTVGVEKKRKLGFQQMNLSHHLC